MTARTWMISMTRSFLQAHRTRTQGPLVPDSCLERLAAASFTVRIDRCPAASTSAFYPAGWRVSTALGRMACTLVSTTEEHARHIDVGRTPPVLKLQFECGSVNDDPSIVHQHVNAALPGRGRRFAEYLATAAALGASKALARAPGPISWAAVWAACSSRSKRTTRAPACTNSSAQVRPMPLAPPVIRATAASNRNLLSPSPACVM